MLIPNPGVVPPGGYKFVDSSTGVPTELEGTSLEDLASKVLKHRLANRRPPGDPLDEIVSGICRKYPTACRESRPADIPRTAFANGSSMSSRVAAWFAAFYEQARADRGVSESISERRAGVCATCPFNQPIEGCGPCVDSVNRLFFIWRRDRPLPYEKQLAGCSLLGQHNGAAVLASILPKVPADVAARLPGKCWRR